MKFCSTHWDALRTAIDARGLSALIPDSGEQTASNMASSIETGLTIDNFDPLMGAHNAIIGKLMDNGMSGFMFPGWVQCPICYANQGHKAVCEDEGCEYTYDFFIERAADEALYNWKLLTGVSTE